jgi:hypothetical protein
MARLRAVSWLVLTLALVLGAPTDLRAEEWGGITPGASTIETVRGRYGVPSKESREKVDGYDTARWIYEGSKAPAGMNRLSVEFGLLTAAGYRPDLVRVFVVEPHQGVFNRRTILEGWGSPDRVGREEGRTLFFYKAGLVVYLDDTGEDTRSMYFTIPQPDPAPATK